MPWTGIAAAGISALASAGSQFMAGKMNYKSYKRNISLMKLQSELNRDQFNYQTQVNLDNWLKYQSPEGYRKLLEAAGYNVMDIARNGGDLQPGGSFGGSIAGTGIVNSQPVASTDLSGAGTALASAAESVQRAKLADQQAKTESKRQWVMETTGMLNIASKENVEAETAYQNIVNYIAGETKDDKVKETKNRAEQSAYDLFKVYTESKILDFELAKTKPAEYANIVAETNALYALVLLRGSQIRLTNQEARLVAEKVKTEAFQRALLRAQELFYNQSAFHQQMQGIFKERQIDNDVPFWQARLMQYQSDNQNWQAKVNERTYNWMPWLNISKILSQQGELFMEIFGAFYTRGKSLQFTRPAKKNLNAKRNYEEGMQRMKSENKSIVDFIWSYNPWIDGNDEFGDSTF